MMLAVQNLAVDVSTVFGFVLEPCTLISLKAATHNGLDSDGGGGGRNWSGRCRMNGVTDPTHGVCGAWNAGGVRRQTPGPGVSVENGEVEAIGVTSPSPVRPRITPRAATDPKNVPRYFDRLFGIAAIAS